MANVFYKIYYESVTEIKDKELNEQEKLNNEVLGSGAVLLYSILWKNIARKYWTDKPGCPLKRDYFDKGILACSLSIPLLMELSGYGEYKVKAWIKLLVDAGWITKKRGVLGGRNILTLGTHSGTGKTYREELYKDSMIPKQLTEDELYAIWLEKQDPLMLALWDKKIESAR